MPNIGRNGNRRPWVGFFHYSLEHRFQQEVRRMLPDTRRQALAWLRRRSGRPERVFWEILPAGGRRRL
jgi:hypothetical protein